MFVISLSFSLFYAEIKDALRITNFVHVYVVSTCTSVICLYVCCKKFLRCKISIFFVSLYCGAPVNGISECSHFNKKSLILFPPSAWLFFCFTHHFIMAIRVRENRKNFIVTYLLGFTGWLKVSSFFFIPFWFYIFALWILILYMKSVCWGFCWDMLMR